MRNLQAAVSGCQCAWLSVPIWDLRFWEGWDLFKLKGERHEGSLGWRGGGGAERRAGFRAAPHRRPLLGTGRQTLQATL